MSYKLLQDYYHYPTLEQTLSWFDLTTTVVKILPNNTYLKLEKKKAKLIIIFFVCDPDSALPTRV